VFGISGFELLIVVVFVLIIFGPDKLPELGRTVGRAMRMFKKAQDDMERVIRMEMFTAERQKATASGEPTPADLEEPVSPQESAAEAVSAAASAWAATSEDDDEEEDEE
jgi:TatA/E family protein of Tat protein translocase